jgi:hypothetical protein
LVFTGSSSRAVAQARKRSSIIADARSAPQATAPQLHGWIDAIIHASRWSLWHWIPGVSVRQLCGRTIKEAFSSSMAGHDLMHAVPVSVSLSSAPGQHRPGTSPPVLLCWEQKKTRESFESFTHGQNRKTMGERRSEQVS